MSYLVATLNISTADDLTATQQAPASSAVLNFLMALTRTELKFLNGYDIRLMRQKPTPGVIGTKHQAAGTGSFSSVEVGEIYSTKQLIAIKRNRLLSQTLPHNAESVFDRHFLQIALELRILSNKSIAKHPNIIDVLGLHVDEGFDGPLVSLILEYSSFGDLRTFLLRSDPMTISDSLQIARQIARGLEALHELKICHGDIKLDNVLVFQDQETWCFKLSDFGSSVIARREGPSGCLGYPSGTLVYNAPEIRTGAKSDDESFTINDAIQTDIYSFGLFFWEVLLGGHCYVEGIQGSEPTVPKGHQLTVDYLSDLLPGSLMVLALKSAEHLTLGVDLSIGQRIEAVLKGCLKDSPEQRISTVVLSKVLDVNESSTNFEKVEEGVLVEESVEWIRFESLYEMMDDAFKTNVMLLDDLPLEIRERFVLELETLFYSENFSEEIRGQAAMILSECYSIRFGCSGEKDKIVEWLGKAASLHPGKARNWYNRVCTALSTNLDLTEQISTRYEKEFSNLPSEKYLISRIRFFNGEQLHDAKQTFKHYVQTSQDSRTKHSFHVPIFNRWTVDSLSELHVASWIGDDSLVKDLLQTTPVNIQSVQGFTPLHYACFGGNLSTIRMLMSANASPMMNALFEFTPLHLCMHFNETDLRAAVTELLSHGASPTQPSSREIVWEDHDLHLTGKPLDWAVLTRNRSLVQLLLPYGNTSSGLQNAISNFFWEIADIIIQYERCNHESWAPQISFNTIERPFFHWIAHGREHNNAISRTVSLYGNSMVYLKDSVRSDALTDLIFCARTENDFKIIEDVILSSTSAQVKNADENGYSPMTTALRRSKDDTAFRKTLLLLAGHYTKQELEADNGFGYAFLHNAVEMNSQVGVQVLLERGVNINQPTFDCFAWTPLTLCIRKKASLDIFNLLISNGAKNPLSGSVGEYDFLDTIFFSSRASAGFLDTVLAQFREKDLVPIAYMILCLAVGEWRTGEDTQAIFTHLLSRPAMRNHIDDPVPLPSGVTMLHFVGRRLHLRLVTQLLEAGAHPDIPITVDNTQIFPLQIVCAMGRMIFNSSEPDTIEEETGGQPAESRERSLCGHSVATKDAKADFIREHRDIWGEWRDKDSVNELISESTDSAMPVAIKLLEWHQTHGGELFQGITPLHLAAYMGIKREKGALQCLEDVDEPRGYWPDKDREVSPSDLRHAPQAEEFRAIELILQVELELHDRFRFGYENFENRRS